MGLIFLEIQKKLQFILIIYFFVYSFKFFFNRKKSYDKKNMINVFIFFFWIIMFDNEIKIDLFFYNILREIEILMLIQVYFMDFMQVNIKFCVYSKVLRFYCKV